MNSDKPLFSVITVCFNSAASIRETIASVNGQKNADFGFEQVFVDGGSRDTTVQIIRDTCQSQYQLMSEPDHGIYDAMNKGIALAKGEWIIFLNSDDRFYDDNVLCDVAAFISHSPNGLEMVYGDSWLLSRETRYCGPVDLDRLLHGTNLNHQCIFYHRSVFERLGRFNLRYRLFADWDLNIRCFKHPDFRIAYLDRVISVFNDTHGQSDGNIDLEFLRELPCYFQWNSLKFPLRYYGGRFIKRPLRRFMALFQRKPTK